MPVPHAVQEAYERSRPLVASVAQVVKSTVEVWCEQHNYFFRGRVKTAASTAEKLETGRFRSWAEVDDLYAAEVVVPTLAQVPSALEYLRLTFRERKVRGRGIGQKAPGEFRFDAVRFIGTLIPQEGLERLSGVEDVLFEVQILTAFEYAWQVATHDSVYKGEVIDWRRQRLAAHLRASAEQADSLIAAFDNAADTISASPHRDTERREHIVRVCKQEIDEGRIPASLRPESWVRFGENVLNLVRQYGRRDLDLELDRLLDGVTQTAAKGEVPISGTLFQLIIAEVVQLKGAQALSDFPIIDSGELHDIYRIPEIPTTVVM
jgi:ppGpp synthetase/RelA/SpoT-type nucleotidyltranferase